MKNKNLKKASELNISTFEFDKDNENQESFLKIVASDKDCYFYFGHSVAAYNDKIVVGSPENRGGLGAAYIYDLNGKNQIRIAHTYKIGEAKFGKSVAISENKVIVGAPHADEIGAVYIYDINGKNEIKITPPDGKKGDRFGYSVAITNNKVVVGAPKNNGTGSVYVYDLNEKKRN